MEIVKGKQPGPLRAVAYGPEGIGKTTLASRWPSPLFVDVERGSNQLAVDRIRPQSWAELMLAVDKLAADPAGYKTLVIDTADWAEKMLVDALLAESNKASIEDFGYGKGYVHVAERWKRFLDQLGRMQARNGMHVLFLAHAAVRKFEQPDEAGSYDRWELKLLKQSPAILKEWADLVLFCNYRTMMVEIDGKRKAQGGRRVVNTTHHPCWDAKNRHGLPDEMDLPADKLPQALALLLAEVKPAPPPAKTEAKPEPAPAPKPAPAPAPEAKPETKAATTPAKAVLLEQLAALMRASGISKEELGAELGRRGIVPADMNPRDYNEATLGRIVGKWDAVMHNINLARKAA
jgi:hypothetical protein